MTMPAIIRGQASAKLVQTAREQRREPTRAETILWQAVRGKKLGGLRFRRQHPVETFILDLFCAEQMLAIEIDGGIHSGAEQQDLDELRTQRLADLGIRVIRFTNEACSTTWMRSWPGSKGLPTWNNSGCITPSNP